MSLPSIFSYLPDEAPQIIKIAEGAEPQLRATPDVMRAALKSALLTTAGVGAGYGAGRLLGHGADMVSQKYLGMSVPPQYAGAGGAVLGGLLMAVRALHDKQTKEILQRAYAGSKERTG